MTERILVDTLDALRDSLERVARGWLAAGARAFGVWRANECLAAWGAELRAFDLSAPIQAHGQIVGTLRVTGVTGDAAHARLYADADLIARLIALESELDLMTGELVETQDQLLALYDLDRSLRKHLSVPDTLAAVCREATRLVKVAASLAWITTPAGEQIAQYPPAGVTPARQRELIALAMTRGDRVLENDSAENYFVIPLAVHGATNAGLAFINKVDGSFTSPDLKLARAIADQAGAQIENVLLYQERLTQTKFQHEMELATHIQLGLLPRKTPTIAGLDLYGASHAAFQVGGDFYDFIERAAQPFTCVVGDVAGKGMSAAMMMSMTYTVIRNAVRFMPAPTPASVLGRVNDDLYDALSDLGAFVTVFIGQYDPATRELTYANAGHSPVIYCPANGGARLLIADGTAMGVLPGRWWRDQTLSVQPGDVLILATDGFAEAMNPADEMFGYDRLNALVESFRPRSAQAIAQGLFDMVEKFALGRAQADDQTLIVIKGAE